MGRRGVSAGGGQSSLGYLFGNAAEAPAAAQAPPKNEPPVKTTAPAAASQPAVDNANKPTQAPTPTTAAGSSTNNYYRADGQNCGNFITDRPSTKVHAAPGGNSSLNYLFGDGSKK
ncbi:hypothetical protein CASFOL_011797 [Castilleja foliolosa]|uniref:Uncharacterized protein n=1 Tax=Castilleja foliolosa TaxID=1961234 RepID=A0ABD3DNP6_9LAMI